MNNCGNLYVLPKRTGKSLKKLDLLACPQCQNDEHFIELNISGYITNFNTKPTITITDSALYEKKGIFCAECFKKGKYVLVASEGEELLHAHIAEKH